MRFAENLKVLGPGPTWSENGGPFCTWTIMYKVRAMGKKLNFELSDYILVSV
jgi:hypothetical protein